MGVVVTDLLIENRLIAGRYRLLAPLARGGSAAVWHARDEVLDRAVAIKILEPSGNLDTTALARFRAEAVSTGRLTHPGIVATYDTGTDGDLNYIVMELVAGTTLRQLLDARGCLPVARALEIAMDIAEALSHAHNQGVVHRDVKPSNIVIDLGGRAKIADFGIAKCSQGEASSDLTRTGTVVGTAKYLAPEQVEGRSADQRSDCYALGIVLYEMLCGTAPFAGDSELATATARLLTPPRRPGELRSGIPHAVEVVVLRALARDPAARFESAREMYGALAAARPGASSTPVDATPPTGTPAVVVTRLPTRAVPYATPSRSRRRSLAAIAVTGVVVAAVVVAGAVVIGPNLGSAPRAGVAHLPAARAIQAFELDPPPGDGTEDPDAVSAAADGDASTAWSTDTYASRDFGALKEGVGVWVELADDVSFGQVEVSTAESGWSGQIYLAEEGGSALAAWGSPLAAGTNLPAKHRFDFHGRRGRAVLVWITGLPPSRRAQIREISFAN